MKKRSDYTNEEWAFLERMRKVSGNDLLNPTKEEAMSHARWMGGLDTIRGVQQMFSEVVGWDEKLEELKQGDRDLHEILQDEEHGSEALANFLGSAVFLDPVNLIPGIGIAKKAKTMKQALTYGSMTGGAFGAAGYVSEVSPGLFGDEQSRVENAAIGATAGGILGGGIHLLSRMRGKVSPFEERKISPEESAREKYIKDSRRERIRSRVKKAVVGEDPSVLSVRERQVRRGRKGAARNSAGNETEERVFQMSDSEIESFNTQPLHVRKRVFGIENDDQWNTLVAKRKEYRFQNRPFKSLTTLDETIVTDEAGLTKRVLTEDAELSSNTWSKATNIDHTRTKEIIDTNTGIKTEVLYDLNGNKIISGDIGYEKLDPNFIPLREEGNVRGIYRVQRVDPSDSDSEWQALKFKQELDANGNVIDEDMLDELVTTKIQRDELVDPATGQRIDELNLDPKPIRFIDEFDAMDHVQNIILRRNRIRPTATPTESLTRGRGVRQQRPSIKARNTDAAEDAREASQQAKQAGQDPDQASKESIGNRLQDELEDIADNPTSLKTPVVNFYEKLSRTALKNAVFNSWGTSFTGAGGALYGYNASNDPNATILERMATGALWGIGLGAGTNIAGRIKLTGNETLGEKVSRGIINDYGLGKKYLVDLRRELGYSRNSILHEFEEIMINLSKGFTPDENTLLYSFMTGDYKTIDLLESSLNINLTKKQKVKFTEAKTTANEKISEYGNQLVKLGLLNEETWQKNINNYLHRTYKRHLEGTSQQKSFRNEVKNLKIVAQNLRKRGITETIAKSSFMSRGPKRAGGKTWEQDGFKIVKELDDGKVVVHRDFSKVERKAMGEIEDAAFAIGETGRLFAQDIPMAKFFNRLSNESDETGKRFAVTEEQWKQLSDKEKLTYVPVPKSKAKGTSIYSYGKLGAKKVRNAKGEEIIGPGGKPYTAPMYLQKPIFDDINHMLKARGSENDIIRGMVEGLEGVQTTWKKLKTAWIPAVHVNNTISNVLLLDLADTSIKYLPKAVKELLTDPTKKSALYHLARKMGVFDVDLVTKEFNKSRADAYSIAAKKLTGQKAPIKSTFLGYDLPGWTQTIGEYMMPLKKLTVDAAERSYQLEDQFFRMAVFMDRIDKAGGLSKATMKSQFEAASEARKWFIDYDINAPVIDWMRKTTTPFISYTYRVIPLLAEAAIMRPQKFAKWAVAGYLLNKVGDKMSGGSEDSERLTMRDELSRTLYDVPFMPPTLVKMPFRSGEGNSQYLDISRWVPGGDIYEQREQGVPGIPTPFQPSLGVIGDAIGTFIYKKDSFTGQDIDGLGTDEFPLIRDFIRKETPNIPLIPGSYADQRIKQAEKLKKEYEIVRVEGIDQDVLLGTYEGSPYSTKYTPFEAWLYGFGIKLRPQDIQKNKELKVFEFNQEQSLYNRMYSDAERDFVRGRIGPEEKQEQYDKADELLLRLEAEWQAYNDLLSRVESKELKNSIEREERQQRVTGGLIKGQDVPYTKEDPATRINPITGEPYVEEGLLEALQRRQEDRTLMNKGGLLSALQKRRQGYKEGGDPVSEEERQGYAIGRLVSKVVRSFAQDKSGFVSPTIKALIEKAPSHLRGQGISQWSRKHGKSQEVEFLGLDEFVDANPKATPLEVAEGISGNKVTVSKNIRRDRYVENPLKFERTIPDTDPPGVDSSSLWKNTVDNLFESVESDKIGREYKARKEILDHYEDLWIGLTPEERALASYPKFLGLDEFSEANPNATPMEVKEFFAEKHPKLADLADATYEDYQYLDSPNITPDQRTRLSAFTELIDDYGKRLYEKTRPFELLKPIGGTGGYGGSGEKTFAFGSENDGWKIFVDGKEIHIGDRTFSETEAKIRLQQALDLDHGEGTIHKDSVDVSLPGGSNYREVVFNWDNAPSAHTYGHFDDETQIAHALIRDRKLADGTDSLHIDELQSDLHTKGSQLGYITPPKERGEVFRKLEDFLKDNENYKFVRGIPHSARFAHRKGEPGFLDIRYPERDTPDVFLSFADIQASSNHNKTNPLLFVPKGETPPPGLGVRFASESSGQYDQLKRRDQTIDEIADIIKPMLDEGPVPNYPYKDNWYEMVIKNLLLQAIEEGRPALSISGSAPIKARYSEQYSKFYELLYDRRVPSAMRKLANRYGGEFEQGRLDLVDTYGSRHHTVKTPDFAIDNMQSNIIRITPEMRERILEEGIQSFGAGGIVNVTQGDDPSTVDRVSNFMDGINAGRN